MHADLTIPAGHALAGAPADLPELLGQALRQVDESGRLSAGDARRLRRATAGRADERVTGMALDLETWLGPFAALPDPTRRALLRAVADWERAELRGYELGGLHEALQRFLWRLKDPLFERSPDQGPARRLRNQLADVLAHGARRGPAFLSTTLERWRLIARAHLSTRPTAAEAMALCGIDPRDLTAAYATGVSQTPAYAGYWHDPERRNTIGKILGIDLLPAADGYWFIESNGNPGMLHARSAFYLEEDPFVLSLLRFASDRGYRRLVFVTNTGDGIDPIMTRRFDEGGRRHGLEVTLVNLPNVPDPRHPRSYRVPPLDGERTLVARVRRFPTGLDYALSFKHATYRGLARYRAARPEPELLLPAFGPKPVLGDIAPEEPFPNVVYKIPGVELQRGIVFLKARSPEHAQDLVQEALRGRAKRELQDWLIHAAYNRPGVYQAFVRPRFLIDRRLFKVRALVLITPVGCELLSAHRHVCRRPVPARLPFGAVRDPWPYSIGFGSGAAEFGTIPPGEEPLVARAALAAARGLAWVAGTGFQTGPGT